MPKIKINDLVRVTRIDDRFTGHHSYSDYITVIGKVYEVLGFDEETYPRSAYELNTEIGQLWFDEDEVELVYTS